MNRTAFAADVRSITLTRWGIVRSHGTAVLSNKAATATQRDRHRLCAAEPVPAALDFALERDWLGYRSAVLASREALTRIAHAAAAVDLVCGLAQAAAEGLWSESDLLEDTTLTIDGGRHPVAEALLEAEGRTFVPNDCRMDETAHLWLLTGPNMAGKSTFLRQVAILVLMAQIGSFVPASRARLGVVDKMFSRIGASDDLAAGRSTFMVDRLTDLFQDGSCRRAGRDYRPVKVDATRYCSAPTG